MTRSVPEWLAAFDAALRGGDPAAVTALFVPDCYWRDLLAFTWNIKTMEGPAQIADMLAATLTGVRPGN